MKWETHRSSRLGIRRGALFHLSFQRAGRGWISTKGSINVTMRQLRPHRPLRNGLFERSNLLLGAAALHWHAFFANCEHAYIYIYICSKVSFKKSKYWLIRMSCVSVHFLHLPLAASKWRFEPCLEHVLIIWSGSSPRLKPLANRQIPREPQINPTLNSLRIHPL
jgi:hypothetical protein